MGRNDFTCNCRAELISSDGFADTLRVHCYWKCNGWRYEMSRVYGWVTCNGEERLVANNISVNFQNLNGEYELGYSDFRLNRGQSNFNVNYSARLESKSSYASGKRSSGAGTHTVGALASHTVSYNANGGTGAPGNQTKWYGSVLILSGTRPTRTGHTFQGWATSPSGGVAYQPGGQYGADANVTLYAVWKANTWTVTYNANGGIGAPATQIKTYGQTLKLSTTKPTKVDYNFLGWATSTDGPVVYQPGSNYIDNNNITLYAKWELAYVRPRITELNIYRCISDGTASESGTNLRLDFKWATDLTGVYAKLQYKKQTATEWTTVSIFDNNSATSGIITKKVLGNNAISSEESWTARIYIYDSKGIDYATYSSEFSISTVAYPIDVKKGGKGVAFGKVAELDDLFDVNMPVRIRKEFNNDKTIIGKGIISDRPIRPTDANIPFSDEYISTIEHFLSSSNMSANKPPFGDGHILHMHWDDVNGYDVQIGIDNITGQMAIRGCDKNNNWGKWRKIFQECVLYDNASGTAGTVTLSESAANFDYIEIYYIGNTEYFTSIKLFSPDGKQFSGSLIWPAETINIIQIQAKYYKISGNTITNPEPEMYSNLVHGAAPEVSRQNTVKIYKVVGYR